MKTNAIALPAGKATGLSADCQEAGKASVTVSYRKVVLHVRTLS